MTEAEPGRADAVALDEMREAASAVIASLKRLLDATERVVEDPEVFVHVVATGRSMAEEFITGFASQAAPRGDAPGDPTEEG